MKNFIRRNLIRIEITLLTILFLVVVLSVISYLLMFSSFENSIATTNFFGMMWFILYYPNFLIYFVPSLGMTINLLFYTILLLCSIIGLIKKSEEMRYKVLHIVFIFITLAHLLIFRFLYHSFKFIAGV
jgi:hypothetical protein